MSISHAKRQIFKEHRNSRPKMFCKKGGLRNFTKFTGKHLCQSLYLIKLQAWGPEACNFTKKEALAHVLLCEICEISKSTFSYRTSPVAVLRAPNFVNMSRLCTIQNNSNSLAKAHLITPFLQNSSQWLLWNVSFFLKGKTEKIFIPLLTLIRLKSCNCIKIIHFIHYSEKIIRIYLPIFSI